MSGINWEILKELAAKTSDQLIKKLIESFLSSFDHLVSLESNYKNEDLKWLKGQAHQIKSTAAMLGATHLSIVAYQAEKSESLEDESWTKLFNELKKVRSEFKSRANYL